jgi:RNA polymerase sigma factor (sigma-70 family)
VVARSRGAYRDVSDRAGRGAPATVPHMRLRRDRRYADDRALLQASRAGAGGFELFYTRHRRTLLAYFAQRVRNPEVAADLTAETFAAALLAVQDPARELPRWPAAWLFAIAQRKLIDSVRRGRVEAECRRRLGLERIAVDDENIERIVQTARSTDVAWELAQALPPDQLEALRARVLGELEYPLIARRLGCSELVVRKRVSRALASLRASLGSPDG